MSEPTLQDCINYMRSQIKQMEKHPRNYEFNLPYYRKTVELLETRGTTNGNCATCVKAVVIDERPHGEWIRHIDDLYPEESTEECSVCHEEQRITGNDDDFCPNCGADMRTQNDRSWDTSERGVSGSVSDSITQKEGESN